MNVSKRAAANAFKLACMALTALVPGSPALAQAQSQLISQNVMGAYRICRYRNPVQDQLVTRPYVERAIGRGEPCPIHYSPEPQRARRDAIPSMATLQRQERVGNQQICTYGYMGRRYSRTIASTATCTMTPLFSN